MSSFAEINLFSYKIIELLLWYFVQYTYSLLSFKSADFRQNDFHEIAPKCSSHEIVKDLDEN